MRLLAQSLCACLIFLACGELRGQDSIPPVSRLQQVVSNLTAAASATSDANEVYKLYGKMKDFQKFIDALLPVLDVAAERSDRTASDFRKKAESSATEENSRSFYRDRAVGLAKQTDQILMQRAELETVGKSLAQAMTKIRCDPSVKVLIETDEAIRKVDGKLGTGCNLNHENKTKADFIKSVTPDTNTSKEK